MTPFRKEANTFDSVTCTVACRQTEARLPVGFGVIRCRRTATATKQPISLTYLGTFGMARTPMLRPIIGLEHFGLTGTAYQAHQHFGSLHAADYALNPFTQSGSKHVGFL